MSQRFGLYPDLTVMENLDFYADIYGVPRRERDAQDRPAAGLQQPGALQKRLAGNLSGGMKQKLGLACALIHTPKVLFLDEPTNGVDPVSRRDFWRILYQLLEEGSRSSSRRPTSTRRSAATAWPSCTKASSLACDTPAELKRLMRGHDAGSAARTRPAARPSGPARVAGRGERSGSSAIASTSVSPRPRQSSAEQQSRELLGRREHRSRVDRQRRADSWKTSFVVAAVGRHDRERARRHVRAELPQTPDPAVVVDDLEKRFGDFVAVDRISFEVRKGEIFGFLGPNGAGKSTTIRMLCGILAPPPGAGTRRRLRHRAPQTEQIKTHIGYMSQRFSLYEDLTVEENIDFFAGIYGIPAGEERRSGSSGSWRWPACAQRSDSTSVPLRRLEAAAGPRLRDPPRAADSLPRRADLRRRPHQPPPLLGPDLRALRRAA